MTLWRTPDKTWLRIPSGWDSWCYQDCLYKRVGNTVYGRYHQKWHRCGTTHPVPDVEAA